MFLFQQLLLEILSEVILSTGDSTYMTLSLVCRWFRDVVTQEVFRKAAHFAWLDSKIFFPFNAHSPVEFCSTRLLNFFFIIIIFPVFCLYTLSCGQLE